jgi:predicted esterase
MTRNTLTAIGSFGLALCLTGGFIYTAPTFAQDAAAKKAPKGINRPPDPRVQQRKYHFADTNEDLAYALFVSSKVTKDKKAPLVVMLHGLGGDHNNLLRSPAVDLAEEGGYIIVGPMGYNPRGWYGTPVGQPRAGGTGKSGAGKGGAPKGNAAPNNDPPNLRELSEKDVMNVLELVRKEFNVDDQRTYLMGHSMGGAGALYLGVKYASNWAAIGALAPAAFAMQPNAAEMLTPVKDTMPVIIVQGGQDPAVPVDRTRQWIATMKDLKMNYKYVEMGPEDHGTIIPKGMPEIFRFFAEHSKPASH